MNIHCVFTSYFSDKLSYSLKKRSAFNITYCTADFSNYKIELVFVTEQFYVPFDFIRDMRDDLYCFA